jgi:hypothetical protein
MEYAIPHTPFFCSEIFRGSLIYYKNTVSHFGYICCKDTPCNLLTFSDFFKIFYMFVS